MRFVPVTAIRLFLFLLFLPAGANADTGEKSVDIKEWLVPWEDTRPRDPYVDPKGRVWFCGQAGAYIAYFDPETEKFKKYDLEEGSAPHNLIVDKKGYVWFAGNARGYIGRLSPKSGKIKKYPMPRESVRDPHTLVFDGNGDIWFTAQFSNAIGKLFVDTGEVKIFDIPVENSRPYGISVDSKNRPWVVLFATNRLVTVNPETYQLGEIELPREEIRPRRLAITSYDKIWFVDYATGHLGRYDPKNGNYTEYRLPGGENSRPYGMAVDNRDLLWLVETGFNPNRLVSFNPWKKEFDTVTEIPSGGGTVRHMYFDPVKQEIWFGTDTNFIGRASLPEQIK